MVNICVCYGCDNNSRTEGTRFHAFPPRESQYFAEWVRFVMERRPKFSEKAVGRRSFICRSHFQESDYEHGHMLQHKMGLRVLGKVCLEPYAVPSVQVTLASSMSAPPRISTAVKKIEMKQRNKSSTPTSTSPNVELRNIHEHPHDGEPNPEIDSDDELECKDTDMAAKVGDIKQSWHHDEVVELIRLWKDYQEQMEGFFRKKATFVIIAKKLKKLGYDKTSDQVRKKIQNLRGVYRRINSKTTDDNPSTWVFYSQVHEVMSSRLFYNDEQEITEEAGYSVLEPEIEVQEGLDERIPLIDDLATEVVDIKQSWHRDEVLDLIRLWKNYQEQLWGCCRKKTIFTMIAKKLKELGHIKTPNQVRKKIQNLKDVYRRIKLKTIDDKPSTWIYYSQVHEIMGSKPFFNDKLTIGEEARNSVLEPEIEAQECLDERIPPINYMSAEVVDMKHSWHHDEAVDLIKLWKEYQEQLFSCPRKQAIFSIISKKLSKLGHNKSPDHVQKKIQNLKDIYRRSRPKVDDGKPSSWAFYSQVDEIMSSRMFDNAEQETSEEAGYSVLGPEIEVMGDLDEQIPPIKNMSGEVMDIKQSWHRDEVLNLLQLWKDCQEQSEGCSKKKFAIFAEKLKELGYNKTTEQVRKKIQNLKDIYRRTEHRIAYGRPSTWGFYNQMHEIMSFRPFYNEQEIIEEVGNSVLEPEIEVTGGLDEKNSPIKTEVADISPRSSMVNNDVAAKDIKLWPHDDVFALIRLWKDHQELLESYSRKKAIFALIAKKLTKLGYNKTPDQVIKKIQNLKDVYRRVELKKTIDDKPSTWIFYSQVHEIMGSKPLPNDEQTITEEAGNSVQDIKIEVLDDSYEHEQAPLIKRRKLRENNKVPDRRLMIAEELLLEIKRDKQDQKAFSDALLVEMKVMNKLLAKSLEKN